MCAERPVCMEPLLINLCEVPVMLSDVNEHVIDSFVLGKTCLTENIALQQHVPVSQAEVLLELITLLF